MPNKKPVPKQPKKTPANKKSALLIGRFQPLHLGHISVLKDALQKFDSVLICIGSSNKFRTLENPFTVGERHAMFKHTLDELGVSPSSYRVIPIPDFGDDKKWLQHLLKTCPNFETVISGNQKVREIFQQDRTKKVLKPQKKYRISSTEVREAIIKNQTLDKYTSKAVISFLNKIGATPRIMTEILNEDQDKKEPKPKPKFKIS